MISKGTPSLTPAPILSFLGAFTPPVAASPSISIKAKVLPPSTSVVSAMMIDSEKTFEEPVSLEKSFGEPVKSFAVVESGCAIPTDQLIVGLQKRYVTPVGIVRGFAVPRELLEKYKRFMPFGIQYDLESESDGVFIAWGRQTVKEFELFGELQLDFFNRDQIMIPKPEYNQMYKIIDLKYDTKTGLFAKLANNQIVKLDREAYNYPTSDAFTLKYQNHFQSAENCSLPVLSSTSIPLNFATTAWTNYGKKMDDQEAKYQSKLAKEKEKKAIENTKKSIQPLRFSSRRTFEPPAYCVTSAAAANMFKSVICMSSSTEDTEAYDNASKDYITDHAKLLASPDGWDEACQMKLFRAIRLGTPGHVSIALWDREKNVIEVFDPSGRTSATDYQDRLLRKLFGDRLQTIKVIHVNDKFLQQQDKHCQTWIYYYLYQRTIAGESAQTLIQRLQKLTPMQRFELINQFWNNLVRSGGNSYQTRVGAGAESHFRPSLKPPMSAINVWTG